MLDPYVSMAMSVQSRKGVYALLLGSGISRAASIPTGWEVVEDLIKRVASISGEKDVTDPVAWYKAHAGEEPTYSGLLRRIATTPGDRAHLLKTYFEPTDEQREEGLRVPTRAHKAIARLVREGHVRVIVTTNFDRLLEQALHEEAVNARIVSNEDAARGAIPLQHADCTIVKINGDYLDLATRNTSDELARYGEASDALLDRVFSEYGLIVAGWSADWDGALRDAITRNTRHRFSTYWLLRSHPGEHAARLISVRQAMVIRVESADHAFEALEGKVAALAAFRESDPISPDLAMNTAKRLLAEDRHRIALESLVMAETARLRLALDGPGFSVASPMPNADSIRERAERSEAATANLSAILMVGGYWGNINQCKLWIRCLCDAITHRSMSGTSYDAWTSMRFLPAALLFYHVGIAALAAERYDILLSLFTQTSVPGEADLRRSILYVGSANIAFPRPQANELFPPDRNRKTPASDWIHSRLRTRLGHFVGGDPRYSELFNQFELLVGMVHFDLNQNEATQVGWRTEWMPNGRYIWQSGRNYAPAIFRDEVKAAGTKWPPFQAGFFGGSCERAQAAIAAIENIWGHQSW